MIARYSVQPKLIKVLIVCITKLLQEDREALLLPNC
jgi:hypothetical protein